MTMLRISSQDYRIQVAISGARKIAEGLFGGLVRIEHEFAVRQERQRSRRQLLQADDRTLRDIGITRSQARREALRGFWD